MYGNYLISICTYFYIYDIVKNHMTYFEIFTQDPRTQKCSPRIKGWIVYKTKRNSVYV